MCENWISRAASGGGDQPRVRGVPGAIRSLLWAGLKKKPDRTEAALEHPKAKRSGVVHVKRSFDQHWGADVLLKEADHLVSDNDVI